MPRLRVVAGTSLDDLHPISVNTGRAHPLSSPLFAGSVVAHIKDFPGPDSKPTESEYFEREDRKGVTWSIQVQGRFIRPVSADDVLFGNTFDRPLHLPWGSSAAFKFMKYVDPTLEHDLTSRTKPWALSPLLSTMPHLAHDRLESEDASMPRFPTKESLTDDVKSLHLAVRERERSRSLSPAPSSSSSPSSGSSPSGSTESVVSVPSSVSSHGSASASGSTKSSLKLKSRLKKGLGRSKEDVNEDGSAPALAREIGQIGSGDAKQRRAFFADAAHRRDVVLGPQDVLTTDFCYGFMAFWPSLALQLPGGLSFDLMKYWDGQPVRFVCCERKGTGGGEGGSGEDEGGDPWGRVFWCVAIELVEDEADVD